MNNNDIDKIIGIIKHFRNFKKTLKRLEPKKKLEEKVYLTQKKIFKNLPEK